MSEKRKDSKGRLLNKGEYQRKDLSYEYRFTDVDGKRRSIYAPTLKKLREEEKTINRDIEDGICYGSKDIVLIDYLKDYISLKPVKKTTVDNHKKTIKRLMPFSLMKKKIKDIREIDCRKFVLEYSVKYFDETVKKAVYYIKGCLEMAVREGIIRRNPFMFDWKSLLSGRKREKVALTEEEFNSLIEFFSSKGKAYSWYVPIFVFIKETGLRSSEFYGLSLEEIDLENNTITVNHQLYFDHDTHEFSLETLKTKSSYGTIPLTRKAREALQILMDRCEEPVELLDPDGKVQHCFIRGKSGSKYALVDLAQIKININRAMKKYNAEHPEHPLKFSHHVLRHTATTSMLRDGVNVATVQRILRHSTSQITLEVYTHINQDDVKKEIERVYGAV